MRRAAGLLALALAAACARPTGVLLELDLTQAPSVERVRLDGRLGSRALPARTLPEEPRALLPREDVLLLLPDRTEDPALVLVVAGLAGDAPVAGGTLEVTVVEGQVVDARLALAPPAGGPPPEEPPPLAPPGEEPPDEEPPDEEPPVSGPGCGDGVVDEGEACDGAPPSGASCLALGKLRGGGPGVTCTDACTLSTAGCAGGDVDDEAALRAAVAEAEASPGADVIALRPGVYALSQPLVLDAAQPIELRPLSGAVRLDARDVDPAIEVKSAGHRIVDVAVADAKRGVVLDSGGTHLERVWFENLSRAPDVLVADEKGGNRVQACRFSSTLEGGEALRVKKGGSTLAMNVIEGRFARGLHLDTPQGSPTRLDHNSVALEQGDALVLKGAREVCVRASFFSSLSLDDVQLDSACASSANAAPPGAPCRGGACADLCDGGGALCAIAAPPPLAGGLCPAAGSPLLDAAPETGWDLVDADPALYFGAAADVGARERGAARTYGGVASACP